MNRDPFDTLRSRNPAPRESLPEAPMALASKIAAGRPTLRRGLAIATAAAAVVLVAGGGWLIWSRAGSNGAVVGPTTTTGPAAPVTEVPELTVYFLKDGALIPVARDSGLLDVNPLPDLRLLALDLLLSGPAEFAAASSHPSVAAEAELTSAIPEGTKVLGVAVIDGIAAVDFSAEFTEAPPEALAQVVFTLTGPFMEAEAVHFLIEGVPHGVTSPSLSISQPHLVPEGMASALVGPITRRTFAYSMGAGGVTSPPLGGTLRDPWPIFGMARGPVDRVGVRVTELDGSVVYEEVQEINDSACSPWYGICDGTDDWDRFVGAVPNADAALGRWVTLTSFLIDEAGVETVLSSWPVWLEPSTDAPTDTGAATTTTMGEADDAPTVVVYFLDADTGAAVPVARDLSVLNVRPLPDLGPLAVELLLSGPGAWDAAPLDAPVAAAEARLTTAIPEGTTLLAFDMADGTVTVDLSAEFLSGDPETLSAAFAQLVFTVTRLEDVQNVRVLVAGSPASPLGGAPGPLTWQDVDGFVPEAVIAYPPLGGTLHLPDIIVAGAFGPITLTLIDADGTELWNATVVGGTDCCAAAEVPADLVDYGRWVTLLATGIDGGAAGASFEMPIWLAPYVPFTDEPGIPEATTLPGLGDLTPFPPDMSAGCAPETARVLASFEAALAEGRRDLGDLCSVLGAPDWLTGSGLWIPVYDLDDGSRLYLGYTGPGGDGLIYANLVSPDGTMRDLLGG